MLNQIKVWLSDAQFPILNSLSLSSEMEAILIRRIKSKKRTAKIEIIDYLHRQAIRNHQVLNNNMYFMLLHKNLPRWAWGAFFNDYYHASCYGFFKTVLPQALKSHKNPLWHTYIEEMIEEESSPRLHHIILKEFIESCGFRIGEPVVTQKFLEAMVKGFCSELPFALGYSLAIEVEGAYQIDLIEQSCSPLFSEQLQNTIWFQIHLDSTGEEEHANMAVNTIENIVDGQSNYQQLCLGFFQACNDTYDFMESLHKHITKLSVQE